MGVKQPTRTRDWFRALFDEHHHALLAYAVRRVGPDEAEDVVAEVFTTLWRRRDEVPAEVRPWLYGVARHEILHTHRGTGRRQALRQRMAQQTPGPDDDGFARVEIDAVLDQLDPTDAEVLRLTVWEQLTPSEIALTLGISAPAARQRLLRARNRAQRLHALHTDQRTTA